MPNYKFGMEGTYKDTDDDNSRVIHGVPSYVVLSHHLCKFHWPNRSAIVGWLKQSRMCKIALFRNSSIPKQNTVTHKRMVLAYRKDAWSMGSSVVV